MEEALDLSFDRLLMMMMIVTLRDGKLKKKTETETEELYVGIKLRV